MLTKKLIVLYPPPWYISLAGANFESRPDTSLDFPFLTSSALEDVTSILRYINVSILFYINPLNTSKLKFIDL